MSIRNDDAHELAELNRIEAERQSRLVATERMPVLCGYADPATAGLTTDQLVTALQDRGYSTTLKAGSDYERLIERIRTLATQLSNAGMHTAAEWTRALLDT